MKYEYIILCNFVVMVACKPYCWTGCCYCWLVGFFVSDSMWHNQLVPFHIRSVRMLLNRLMFVHSGTVLQQMWCQQWCALWLQRLTCWFGCRRLCVPYPASPITHSVYETLLSSSTAIFLLKGKILIVRECSLGEGFSRKLNLSTSTYLLCWYKILV